MSIVFWKTLLAITLLVSPMVFLVYWANRKKLYKPMDDISTIRYIKEQEMIEGMKK